MDDIKIPEGLTPEEEAWFRREMASPIVETANTANTVASLQSEILRLRSEVKQRTSVIYGEGYTEGMKDGAEGLQAELAAALARAQAAEEEAARLRVLFTEAVGREEELRDVLAAIRGIVASIQTNMHGMYIEQVDREKIVGGLENVHKVVHKALN